jgi:hypothetical protein
LDQVKNFNIAVPDYVPQQQNGYDCGLFVCLNMEIIARTGSWVNFNYLPDNESMDRMRAALLRDITCWTKDSKVEQALLLIQDPARNSVRAAILENQPMAEEEVKANRE